jgi:DNA-binding transcriptional MerR regulator
MHIGEVARRAGLSVKTVRYYSDVGLVPEAARTAAGYRRYDGAAVVRLEFVRALRELGLDLTTIRRVLEQKADLPAVAAAHADVLGTQIRLLRMQRAALRALSRRAAPSASLTPEEVDRMNRLAQATADERRRIIAEFLDAIFEGIDVPPEFAERMRTGAPDLPEDASDEQVDAWIELAELVRDEGFRQRLRDMSRRSFGTAEDAAGSAGPAGGAEAGADEADGASGGGATGGARQSAAPTGGSEAMRTANLVSERAGAAVTAGIDPASDEAQSTHDALVAAFAESVGRVVDEDYRRELLDAVIGGYEPRAERYWQLVAIINGWPPIPSAMPAWAWFRDSLAARLPTSPD